MKAAVYEAVGRVELADRPTPTPQPGELLVRVARCGVCATDQHIYHGVFPADMPVVGGHELAGTVEAVGGDGEAAWLGRRVAVDPLLFCGECHFCRTGRRNHCLHSGAIGVTRDGGFAECAVVPAEQAYDIGELAFAAAALSEPLACVLWGVKMAGELAGRSVLIVGAGPIGLLWLQAARHANAAGVVVADRQAERLGLAERLGAEATVRADATADAGRAALAEPAGHGYDVAVDATGVADVVAALPALVAPGGTVCCFGVCRPDARIEVSPYDIYRRDLRIVGGYAINETFGEAVAMLRAGKIQAEPLVSHTLALGELSAALDGLAGSAGAAKVQLAPNG